jgi:alginate O-acetyltransferase complex protein AlgI
VPAARRSAVLAFWGAVFYVLYAPASAPLIFGLIVTAYLIPSRFWIVPAGLSLGTLAFYKLATRSAGLSTLAAQSPSAGSRVLLPLGLSFLAFELVHFCVERKRGKIGDVTLADYLAFTLFFPCRVAGPIKRYPDFSRAVAEAAPSAATVYAGLLRIMLGVLKKVALADLLGLTVGELAYASTPAHIAKVVLAFTFEIYLDFSAYSDMAIGVSRLFGIGIPENFRAPYLSQSIQEFWTRWHISLSSWIRDYVFVPFGRWAFTTRLRRTPTLIAVLSYLVSFLAVGAWHGLTANFLLWGLYHGTLLSAHHVYKRSVPARLSSSAFYHSASAKLASVALTFGFVAAGWEFCLTEDPAQAARLLRVMTGRP